MRCRNDRWITGIYRCGLRWHWVFEADDLPDMADEGHAWTEARAKRAWHAVCAEYNRRRLGGYPKCALMVVGTARDYECTNPATETREDGRPVCAGHIDTRGESGGFHEPWVPPVPPLPARSGT